MGNTHLNVNSIESQSLHWPLPTSIACIGNSLALIWFLPFLYSPSFTATFEIRDFRVENIKLVHSQGPHFRFFIVCLHLFFLFALGFVRSIHSQSLAVYLSVLSTWFWKKNFWQSLNCACANLYLMNCFSVDLIAIWSGIDPVSHLACRVTWLRFPICVPLWLATLFFLGSSPLIAGWRACLGFVNIQSQTQDLKHVCECDRQTRRNWSLIWND